MNLRRSGVEEKLIVRQDAEEADIQRLVNGLRAAKNNKNTMRLISQGENAALQSTFMNQTSSITRNTAEQSRKRKGAPSAAERLQKKVHLPYTIPRPSFTLFTAC